MLPFWRSESETPRRIEIEVQVETRVDVDNAWGGLEEEGPSLGGNSHGSAPTTPPLRRCTPTAATPARYKSSPYLRYLNPENHMVYLPRTDYDPRRVCLNPCPNLTLGKYRRTIGVYLAGALVCLLSFRAKIHQNNKCYCIFCVSRSSLLVCAGELDVPGCCCAVITCKVQMGG